MMIIIKFLLAVCLCFIFTNFVHTDDTESEHHVSPVEGEFNTDNGERSKRLSTSKIKDTFDKIGTTLDKKISDKLEDSSAILGSIRGSSSLLKSKTKLPTLLDGYKSSIGSSLSRLDLTSLLKPSYTAPKQITPTTSVPSPKPTTRAPAPTPASLFKSYAQNSHGPVKTAAASESKPVVLPDYLKEKDIKPKIKHASNQITVQQLRETANLRKEIDYAVSHNIYAHSSTDVKNMNQKDAHAQLSQSADGQSAIEPQSPYPQYYESHAPSFENFFSDFWQNLIGQAAPKPNREQSVGSVRSDFSYVPENKQVIFDPSPQDYASNNYSDTTHDATVNDDDDATVEKMMAKAAMKVMKEGIISNTVESYANNGEEPDIEMSQVREELKMTSIIEDMNFNIGENVIGWRTLKRNTHESHALIGMTKTSIVLVHEKNGVYKVKSEEMLLSQPTFFTTYTFWNETQQSIEGIVIVSIQHEIVFYRINEAMDRMEFIWMWPTTKRAEYIHHFVVNNFDTLLVLTESYNGKYAASLYRFDMNDMDFFLRESLSLEKAAKNMALIQHGYDTFMCFPQQNYVIIYKYMEQNFKYFTRIETNHAETVSSFEMGGYSYLAVGGKQPKILRYFHSNFHDQTILSKSWGFVEFFLPVSARTYRDDLILFVQHRVDYGSHTNAYLEALIWNGRAFHEALSVPCYIGDRTSDLGLGCMLDQDRDLGVIGATTFQRNRTISILVPRLEAPSGLFDLTIDLSRADTSMNDHLLEVFSEIFILLQTREEVLQNAQNLLDRFPKDPVKEINIKGQHLDKIYTQSLELGSIVPTQGVFLNDELITEDLVDEFYGLLNEAEKALKTVEETNRSKREDNIKSLQLKSLNVTDLNVRYINDIPVEEFIFIENGTVTIDGTVVVTQSIKAEVVERAPDDMFLGLQLESAESIVIDGDLQFDEINGIKWKDLIKETHLKYLPMYLDEMTVNGTVFLKDSISTENLNDLPFPSGYLFTDGTSQITVSGQKSFENLLVSESLIVFGTLNGVRPSQIVTLNGTQTIPGTTTFRHLEITEALNIGPNGTISGRHLDEFLSNPTLRETNEIRANCYINSLEIEGPLYVSNTMNDIFLDDVFSDIVYKHEPSPQINSFKHFASLQAPNIELTSNIVNGIPFSSFVTKDTEQTFNVNKLDANVQFERLNVGGLIDFINITEVDMNSIKLFGDQFTNAELIFEDGDHLNIDVQQLEILDTINNISVHDFISIDEDFELNGDIQLNGLKVNRLVINDGDIIGNPDNLVNGVNLQKLVDSHLSKTNAQIISEPIHFGTVVLRNGFDANIVNGFDFNTVLNTLKNLKTNEQLLNASQVSVNQMLINGSVWFDNLNGHDIEYIKQNAIRLDQTNNIDFPIVFLDPVFINGNMNVEKMNSVNFNEFVNDLVRKSANQTRIYGTTIFEEDVTIQQNAEVTTINEQQVDLILTKNYNREIISPIEIHGDVFIQNLIVDGELNGIGTDQINTYSYDESSDTFYLQKDVFFNETINVKYLDLYGGYNKIGNIQQHLTEIIRTDRPAVIKGTIRFTESIHFDSAVDIVEFHEINVPNFLSNVILIDQYDPVDIYADVSFQAPVRISNWHIAGDLTTATLNNCSVTDWIEKSIRTDQPLTFNGTITFPDGTFQGTNINTKYINDMPVDELLTLNTPQNFSRPVRFGEVYSSVPFVTNGLVSGYDLKRERDNTLMTQSSGDQYIDIPVVFGSIRVLKNLITNGLVNGRDIRMAISLQDDITIDSPLSFDTIEVDKVYTDHMISGINFNAWTKNALRRYSPVPQVVTAPWNITTAVVDTIISEKGINGMETGQFLQYYSQSKQNYQQNVPKKCQSTKNSVILSQFEKYFSIDAPNVINSIHFWNEFDQNYMVLNSGCESYVYTWSLKENTFVPLSTIVTGDVVQWIHVQDVDGEKFLISNNDGSVNSNCPVGGAFIWRLDRNLKLLIEQVQFGLIADFKSVQTKPNSHAFFYALRSSDNHLVEYNLRGAIITEWNVDNVDTAEPTTASVHLVPGEANLGLALSNGAKLSILTSCNCTKRPRRCSLFTESLKGLHEHREKFEKSIAQFHTDLHNGRNILRSVLNTNEFGTPKNNTPSTLTQKRMEHLQELIQKSKQKTTEILGSILTLPCKSTAVSSSADSETENNQSETLASTQSTEAIRSNGKLIVHLMDAIDNAVQEKEGNAPEMPIIGNATQETEEEQEVMVGTGAELVDLLDLIDKVIEKNNEKHEQENTTENENENDHVHRIASSLNKTEVRQMLNETLALKELLSASKATNESDARVGTLFGMLMLEKSLANTFNRASKVLLGEDEEGPQQEERSEEEYPFGENSKSKKKKHKKENTGLIGSLLGSTHTETTLNGPTEHYKELTNALHEIRSFPDSNVTDAANDTQVGDIFGNLMYKITPVADKIFDNIVDELRRRDNENYHSNHDDFYSLGSTLSNNSHPQFKPSDISLLKNLMNEIDEKLAKNSSDSDDLVGSGSILVDLLDTVDKIIEKNNEKHRHDDDEYDEYANYHNIGATLNKTDLSQMLNTSLNLHQSQSNSSDFNQTNPKVGTIFGGILLEKIIRDTVSKTNHAESNVEDVDVLVGDSSHTSLKIANTDIDDEEPLLGSTHIDTNSNDSTDLFQELTNALHEIRSFPESNVTDAANDTQVGDTFGNLMYKITPVADKIFDNIVDALRRRNNENYHSNRDDFYLVGSTLSNHSRPQFKPSDISLLVHLMNGIDKKLAKNSSDDGDLVGSGSILVDLLDTVDKIIEKNNEKHRHDDYEYDEYANYHNIGATLNKTDLSQMLNASLNFYQSQSNSSDFNQTNPTVGAIIGGILLEKTIADTISKKYYVESEENEPDIFVGDSLYDIPNTKIGVEAKLNDSMHTDTAVNDATEQFKELTNALHEIRNLSKSNDTDAANDTQVGDTFGNLMYKITPVADKIFDNVIDELRRRDNENYQSHHDDVYLGSILSNNSRPQFKPSDVSLLVHLMNGIDGKLAKNSSDSDDLVGSGSILVDLLDTVDKIIEKNNEKHRHDDDEYDEYANYHNIGATLNKTDLSQMLNASMNLHQLQSNSSDFNQTNATMGTIFGSLLLEKTIVDTVSKTNLIENEVNGANMATGLHTSHKINNITTNENSIEHILKMITDADALVTELNKTGDNDDQKVGDAYGNLMFKITPLADNIMDKIMEELRRRENHDIYQTDKHIVGSTHHHHHHHHHHMRGKSAAFIIFKKIGKSLIKAYIFGKKHFKTTESFIKDLKCLYDYYYKDSFKSEEDKEMLVRVPSERLSSKHEMLGLSKNVSIENQKDIELINKMIPNAKEFTAAFAVKMIKHFGNGTMSNGSQNETNTASFWTIFMNGVKSAFSIHANNTQSNANVNETELNAQIFAQFMHELNEMAKDLEHSPNNGSEHKVSSTLNESSEDDMLQGVNENLFNKFTPLFDHLSEKTINELHQREFPQNEHTHEPEDHLGATQTQSTLSDTNETTTESVSTAETIIKEERANNGPNHESNEDCNKNITMEEFVQKLNELKGLYNAATSDSFPLLGAPRTQNDGESNLEQSQRTHHMEVTMVSLPNPLPSHRNSEIVAVRIVSNDRLLVAVTSVTDSTIKSDHDQIQIFESVVDGKVFQAIPCYKPRNLITFTVNMDTLLAFIQDENEVKTYIYRDDKGFVEFASFNGQSPIKQMIHYEIATQSTQSVCPESFLILTMDKHVDFMKAIFIGDCEFNENQKC